MNWFVLVGALLPAGFPPGGAVQNYAMFRLRNLALIWLGRKVWSAARPALERRLRARRRAKP